MIPLQQVEAFRQFCRDTGQSVNFSDEQLAKALEATKPQDGRRKRDAFGYLEPPSGADMEMFAQCGTCHHFTGQTCTLFSHHDPVIATASCNYYQHGTPDPDKYGAEKAVLTPHEAGYVDHLVQCHRCVSFGKSDNGYHCELYEKLNKAMPGIFNLEIGIKEHACCDAHIVGTPSKEMSMRESGEVSGNADFYTELQAELRKRRDAYAARQH